MQYQVRYYTRSGNTEKLAKAIAESIGCTAAKVDTPLAEKTDILFLFRASFLPAHPGGAAC